MYLKLFGKDVNNVFALNGDDENSATSAFGWVLSKSPTLLHAIIDDFVQPDADPDDSEQQVLIDAQKHGTDEGFTDIEILIPNNCHIIIEAKRYWELPSILQLEKYAARLETSPVSASQIVSLSAASREYAASRLPGTINNTSLVHRSWADLHKLVQKTYRGTKSKEEKLWLREFKIHLRGYVSMRNPQDNWVYVVSLTDKPIKENGDHTGIDVVEKDKCYFHPVGNRWPVTPPNYIAFRYYGQLQSVHYIESYKIETDLSSENHNWPKTDSEYFVYELSPAITPSDTVKSGPIRAARKWCFIDTLLTGTCKTISEAVAETKRRFEAYELD